MKRPHIIISGGPRSGKTTLAHMLKNRLPEYNELHCDVLRTYLKAASSCKDIGPLIHTEKYEDLMHIFINETLRASEHPYIVEWSRLYPSKEYLFEERENMMFLYLGHGGINGAKLFEACKTYDMPDTFTWEFSDTQLRSACERWAAVDRRITEECSCLNRTYFETSRNRMCVLEAACEYVLREQ